jgi:hypothetical protein
MGGLFLSRLLQRDFQVSNPYYKLCLGGCRVRIDTVSKARYGTLLKQLGGWGWMQDLLRVSADTAS